VQESGEMYLETIFILSKKMDFVRAIDVVTEMNYSKPSVSRAVANLKKEQAIIVDNDGHITLTEKGLKIAETMYERHKVLSTILIDIGVPENIAITDACKIEHDISIETFEAIKKHIKKMQEK